MGSKCVPGEQQADGGRAAVCVPTCEKDADCQTGTRAGTCDVASSTCKPIVCGFSNFPACPEGYGCVETSGPGIQSVEPLESTIGVLNSPSVPGWCRKKE
jgi:hypothetical protein